MVALPSLGHKVRLRRGQELPRAGEWTSPPSPYPRTKGRDLKVRVGKREQLGKRNLEIPGTGQAKGQLCAG